MPISRLILALIAGDPLSPEERHALALLLLRLARRGLL